MESKHSVCVDWQSEPLQFKQRLSGYDQGTITDCQKHGFALSGFHYTGYEDDVQCMDCLGKCKLWDIQHNPYEAHMRFWPSCKYIRGIESRRYSPIHPEYQELIARRRTFPPWPEQKLQSANSFAAAGFYYIGPLDRVRCFNCGIALKEWGSEDDPIKAHKIACPCCVFIHGNSLQLLGIASSDAAKSADVDLLRNRISEDTKELFDQIQPIKIIKTSGPLFQTLLNLGFDEDAIMQEMRLKVNKTGTNYKSVDEFLDAVWKRGEISKQGSFQSRTDAVDVNTENIHLRDMLFCKSCGDRYASVLFLPCGHLVTCSDCSVSINRCIVCEKAIAGTVRVRRF